MHYACSSPFAFQDIFLTFVTIKNNNIKKQHIMNRHFTLTIALLFTTLCLVAQNTMYVGSYNIRYANKGDRQMGNGWEERCPKLVNLINYEQWDVFGAQEVLHSQLQDMTAGLKDYAYIGTGREDGKTKGEYAPIFYKKNRIKCLKNGQFWLSETPDSVGSVGWDASMERICTWGYFEDKTTKWRFWFFNLHMDHRGTVARAESSKLILAKIGEMCGNEPYILTGDFNTNQDEEPYALLTSSGKLKDTYSAASIRMAENGTYNSFSTDSFTTNRIDHIFVSPRFRVHKHGVLTYDYWKNTGKEYEAHVISDHYPIAATLELPRLRAPQDWAQYNQFAKENETDKDAKVVFMGNSITWNWRRFYPEFFQNNKGYVCRGISGQVTAQMLARFRSDVINLKPKTVVILAGTNDIAMNQGYVSIEHIYENIVSMAELAKCNGIDVVLCSVLPADRYGWSWEVESKKVISSIRELNDKLRTYARKNKLGYADYYSVMADENLALKKEYQQDAVHPNREGYLVMEKVIQEILKKR